MSNPTLVAPTLTQRINRDLYVGQGYLDTIQHAVDYAATNDDNHYRVIIPKGYTGSDTIAAVTGGSANIAIVDERGTNAAFYQWNGTSYGGPVIALTGMLTGPASLTQQGNTLTMDGPTVQSRTFVSPSGLSEGDITTLERFQENVSGAGYNFGNAGGWSTSVSKQSLVNVSRRGISQLWGSTINKHAVGDCAGIYNYIFSDGGIAAQSDEGCTGITSQLIENNGYFHGVVSSTTGTGDRAPVFTLTGGNNWTTDGAFMLNISKGTVSGHLTAPSSFWNGTGYLNQIPTDAALPLTTKCGQVIVGSNLAVVSVVNAGGGLAAYTVGDGTIPVYALSGNVTIAGFTNPANNGTFAYQFANWNTFYVNNGGAVNETHAATATAACIVNPFTTADTPVPVTMTVQLLQIGGVYQAFSPLDVVSIAGNNYPEQSVITAVGTPNGSHQQQITLAIRNPNGAAFIFCGGVQGNFISYDANLAFSAMRSSYYAFGSLDGVHLICGNNVDGSLANQPMPNQYNEAVVADGGASSGFHLFPGAEVVKNPAQGYNCTLEQNRVAWAAGDSVENPHYPTFGGNGAWFLKHQVTPTNPHFGSLAVVITCDGPGWGGALCEALRITNFNQPTFYTSNGGPLLAPACINIQGPHRNLIRSDYGAQPNEALIHINGPLSGHEMDAQRVVEFNYDIGGDLIFVPKNDPSVGGGSWQANNFNAGIYWCNGVRGASGTFTSQDGKTVTVAGGIITGIV